MEKELDFLSRPEQPREALRGHTGGAKISDKIGVINSSLNGWIACSSVAVWPTFLKARGLFVADSLVRTGSWTPLGPSWSGQVTTGPATDIE